MKQDDSSIVYDEKHLKYMQIIQFQSRHLFHHFQLCQMENFRKPNFELVADILYWMVKLYVSSYDSSFKSHDLRNPLQIVLKSNLFKLFALLAAMILRPPYLTELSSKTKESSS